MNYNVKKDITCTHKEVIPPTHTVYINKRGEYIHGKDGCGERLEYLGTRKTGETAEARFACRRCNLFSIFIPIIAIPRLRMEVRLGDIGGYRPNPRYLLNLRPPSDGIPIPPAMDKNLRPRLLGADKMKCKKCGLPHLLLPK